MDRSCCSRRVFLALALGAVTGTVAACSEKAPRTGSAKPFLGDDATAGSPIWAPDPGAFVIGVPDDLAVPPEAVISSGGAIVVIAPNCPLDQRRVGWCPALARFVCPQCSTVFDATGSVEEGPSPRGLTRFVATETSERDLRVDSARRVAGDTRRSEVSAATTRDPACVTLRFPPEPVLVA